MAVLASQFVPSLISLAGAMRGKDYAVVGDSYLKIIQDTGFIVRPLRDTCIVVPAVFRWSKDDANPAHAGAP